MVAEFQVLPRYLPAGTANLIYCYYFYYYHPYYFYCHCHRYCFLWCSNPQWARVFSLLGFHDYTQTNYTQ